MAGRGYVNNGDKKAAEFIAGEFERLKLKKFGGDFYQPFTFPVNTFPGKMELAINGKKLVPGVDFIIDPASGPVSGSFDVISLSASDLLNDAKWIPVVKKSKGKFLVIESYDKAAFNGDQNKRLTDLINFIKYSDDNPAAGTIVLTSDKLTWSVAAEQVRPSFAVSASAAPETITSLKVNADSRMLKKHETQNVLAYLEGVNTDSLIVITAHYDHLGMMGNGIIFPGANDNASGVAMMLSMAQYFSQHKPKYTTVFIAFAGEEAGLLGSTYFVDNPVFPLGKIKFLINFDLAGTGDDGIQVVNGKVYQHLFDRLTSINEADQLVKQIKIRGEACNSDHCMFYRKGVPCFFIYTLGGIQAYHDVYDKAETLPLTVFENYMKLMTAFIETL